MKNILLSLVLTSSLVTSITLRGQEVQDSKEIQVLKDFYREYLTELNKMGGSAFDVETIKAKYLTSRLIQEMDTLELDYDPLINAQDFDSDLFDKLRFEKLTGSKGKYRVSYVYLDSTTEIVLTLIKVKGEYRIDNIEGL